MLETGCSGLRLALTHSELSASVSPVSDLRLAASFSLGAKINGGHRATARCSTFGALLLQKGKNFCFTVRHTKKCNPDMISGAVAKRTYIEKESALSTFSSSHSSLQKQGASVEIQV